MAGPREAIDHFVAGLVGEGIAVRELWTDVGHLESFFLGREAAFVAPSIAPPGGEGAPDLPYG